MCRRVCRGETGSKGIKCMYVCVICVCVYVFAFCCLQFVPVVDVSLLFHLKCVCVSVYIYCFA